MSIEAAREAMESGLKESATEAPSESPKDQDSSVQAKPSTQDVADIMELDKLERFKYKGRELSLKDLEAWEKGHMMQSDYTKKTQALAEERKFYVNLPVDLAAVRENPRLADEFRRVYPEQFHSYLDFLSARNDQQAVPNQHQQVDQKSALDPEIVQRLQKVDQLENYIREQEVKAVDAKLDVIFKKMSEKYQFADEERVLAMAQALHNQGTKLDDSMWEKIFKQVNDQTENRFKTYQKQIIQKQQEATSKAKDIAGGGGIPGNGPKKMSMKEATELAIKHFTGGN